MTQLPGFKYPIRESDTLLPGMDSWHYPAPVLREYKAKGNTGRGPMRHYQPLKHLKSGAYVVPHGAGAFAYKFPRRVSVNHMVQAGRIPLNGNAPRIVMGATDEVDQLPYEQRREQLRELFGVLVPGLYRAADPPALAGQGGVGQPPAQPPAAPNGGPVDRPTPPDTMQTPPVGDTPSGSTSSSSSGPPTAYATIPGSRRPSVPAGGSGVGVGNGLDTSMLNTDNAHLDEFGFDRRNAGPGWKDPAVQAFGTKLTERLLEVYQDQQEQATSTPGTGSAPSLAATGTVTPDAENFDTPTPRASSSSGSSEFLSAVESVATTPADEEPAKEPLYPVVEDLEEQPLYPTVTPPEQYMAPINRAFNPPGMSVVEPARQATMDEAQRTIEREAAAAQAMLLDQLRMLDQAGNEEPSQQQARDILRDIGNLIRDTMNQASANGLAFARVLLSAGTSFLQFAISGGSALFSGIRSALPSWSTILEGLGIVAGLSVDVLQELMQAVVSGYSTFIDFCQSPDRYPNARSFLAWMASSSVHMAEMFVGLVASLFSGAGLVAAQLGTHGLSLIRTMLAYMGNFTLPRLSSRVFNSGPSAAQTTVTDITSMVFRDYHGRSSASRPAYVHPPNTGNMPEPAPGPSDPAPRPRRRRRRSYEITLDDAQSANRQVGGSAVEVRNNNLYLGQRPIRYSPPGSPPPGPRRSKRK